MTPRRMVARAPFAGMVFGVVVDTNDNPLCEDWQPNGPFGELADALDESNELCRRGWSSRGCAFDIVRPGA